MEFVFLFAENKKNKYKLVFNLEHIKLTYLSTFNFFQYSQATTFFLLIFTANTVKSCLKLIFIINI